MTATPRGASPALIGAIIGVVELCGISDAGVALPLSWVAFAAIDSAGRSAR